MRRKIFAVLLLLIAWLVYTYFKEDEPEITIAENYQTAQIVDEAENIIIKDLAYYQNINSDVSMLLILEDRSIPIMNSDQYFRLNINKEYDTMGTPYIDDISTGKNMILQGHSSTVNELMFTGLLKYFDNEYLFENQTIQAENGNGTINYSIFSIIIVDLEQEEPYLRWYDTDYRNDSDFLDYLNEVNSLSIIPIDAELSTSDKVITLVTCDTELTNARVIILAKEVDSG